jgi:hypothetical protein
MRTRVLLTITFGSVLLLVAIAWIRRVTLADSGDLTRVLSKKEIRANPIESIAYLPDGRQIVTGTGGDIVLETFPLAIDDLVTRIGDYVIDPRFLVSPSG